MPQDTGIPWKPFTPRGSSGLSTTLTPSLVCAKCGYLLHGQPLDGACPECALSVGASLYEHHQEAALTDKRANQLRILAAACTVRDILFAIAYFSIAANGPLHWLLAFAYPIDVILFITFLYSLTSHTHLIPLAHSAQRREWGNWCWWFAGLCVFAACLPVSRQLPWLDAGIQAAYFIFRLGVWVFILQSITASAAKLHKPAALPTLSLTLKLTCLWYGIYILGIFVVGANLIIAGPRSVSLAHAVMALISLTGSVSLFIAAHQYLNQKSQNPAQT